MALSIFQKQDIFRDKMIEDFKNGVISNSIFNPYFEWKMGQRNIHSITRKEAWSMIHAAHEELSPLYDKHPHAYDSEDEYINDDPWQMFNGYEEDKYLVSYLEFINDELTNIMAIFE